MIIAQGFMAWYQIEIDFPKVRVEVDRKSS
jgi:hypothetical protein